MRPFETLAAVTTAEGRQLTLHRRGGDFHIHLDGEELMSSRRSGSEAALAERALGELTGEAAKRPPVLIGGLGLGYTLRAALAALPGDARIVVAEIFPAVVEWCRGPLAALRIPIDDPRVEVRVGDVARMLGKMGDRGTGYVTSGDYVSCPPISWSAILLDVDNGPSAWCLGSNRGLYERRGLERIHAALRPGGVLGIWSAYPDDRFLKRLGQAGFEARVEAARAHGEKGARSFLFLARPREIR